MFRSLPVGLLCGFTSSDYCSVQDRRFIRYLVNQIWRLNQNIDTTISKGLYPRVLQNSNLFIKTPQKTVLIGAFQEDNTFLSMNKCHGDQYFIINKGGYRCARCSGRAKFPDSLSPGAVSNYLTQWEKNPSRKSEGRWFKFVDPPSLSSPLVFCQTNNKEREWAQNVDSGDAMMLVDPTNQLNLMQTREWMAQSYIPAGLAAFDAMYRGILAAAVSFHVFIATLYS